MDKEQILRSFNSSLELIISELPIEERRWIERELKALDMNPEGIKYAIKDPENNYFVSLKMANEFCGLYRDTIKKIRQRIKTATVVPTTRTTNGKEVHRY